MVLFKSRRKKQYQYKPFERQSLFARFRSKHHFWSHERRYSKSLFHRLHRTYRSLCLSISLIVRLFLIFDRCIRKLILFLDRIIRIIRIVHGWIQMVRSIFSAMHLLLARFMILIFKIYQIFYLLSILFEPLSNRTIEKAVRTFSHFLYKYYSSNGACYTLKARVYHVIKTIRLKTRTKRSRTTDEEIFYDALNEFYSNSVIRSR